MRLVSIPLAILISVWAVLGILSYNAPLNSDAADLEIHCRYGLCEDRDMATLARYRSFQADVTQDPRLFRDLVLQSPASPELWCDFAEALAEQNQKLEASQAFAHAVSLAPNSPPILLRSATAQLLAGRPTDALPLFRRIFEKAPEYPPENIFSLCSRFGVTPTQILDQLLPPDRPAAAAAYLHFLMRSVRTQDANAAWNWIQTRSLATRALTTEYATFLLSQKAYANAYAVWSSGHETGRSLMTDPGFEAPAEAPDPPFGWRFDLGSAPDFTIAADSSEHHSGAKSLRIRFAGRQNLAFQNVSQLVVVKPGSYEFSVWAKTDALTTDQGLHIAIQDEEHPGLSPLWVSEPTLTGTRPWTRISATVTVPAGTTLIRILVLRRPSGKIDNKIYGTAWFDDFDFASHSGMP